MRAPGRAVQTDPAGKGEQRRGQRQPEVEEAQQQAYRLAQQISWNGCFYRHDIGYRAIARERGEG